MAGTKQKRGKAGNVVRYLTRTQAVKRLQLRLAEFRRLCILKGIHPREPKKKFKGQNKTYYHVKDVNFLLHEPLLESFRQISAYEKKVKKARARKNHELAKQLLKRAPGYRLDHLVRERYPTFVDALRDIDDALCMVHLFATLPGDARHGIPNKMVHISRRLVLEWQAFCCRSAAIRKAFISVKGYYFQAEVQGQMITWLMPHSMAQVLPVDVDYRVMLTFLEFHHTLLQFVFFKLYHGLGLRYPPMVHTELAKAQAELAAIMQELGGSQEAAIAKRQEAAALSEEQLKQRLITMPEEVKVHPSAVPHSDGGVIVERYGDSEDEEEEEEEEEDDGDGSDGELVIDSGDEDDDEQDDDVTAEQAIFMRPQAADADDDQYEGAGPGPASGTDGLRAAGGALASATSDAEVCATLFSGSVVWLSREVPREPLMLLIRAFGGIAAWDGAGSPFKELDADITHQVVDRPVQGHVHIDRVYVQPQWVFDCVNFRVLVPHGDYAPGKRPPPHLSPFVDYREEGYVPDYAQDLLKLQDAANDARRRAAGVELAGGPDEFVAGDNEAQDAPEALAAADAEDTFVQELQEELGNAEQVRRASKRKLHDIDADEELADSQKKALMTRKQRKMYEGLRRKEVDKAERVAELEAKKLALKSQPVK